MKLNNLTTEALRKEQADISWLSGTWHIWLANGKRITSSEEKLDEFYGGWRQLPEDPQP